MLLLKTDAEVRRHGNRTGLETPVVHAENDVCRCGNKISGTYCTFFFFFYYLIALSGQAPFIYSPKNKRNRNLLILNLYNININKFVISLIKLKDLY